MVRMGDEKLHSDYICLFFRLINLALIQNSIRLPNVITDYYFED